MITVSKARAQCLYLVTDASIYHVTCADSPVFLVGSSSAGTSGDTHCGRECMSCNTLQDPHALLSDSSTGARLGDVILSPDSSTRVRSGDVMLSPDPSTRVRPCDIILKGKCSP